MGVDVEIVGLRGGCDYEVSTHIVSEARGQTTDSEYAG